MPCPFSIFKRCMHHRQHIQQVKYVFWSLLIALGFSLSIGSGTAQAQDHIVERAWMEDPTGTLTWPDVQKFPVQAFTGTLSKGFGGSAIWLRLRVSPAAYPAPVREHDLLVLRIRPVYLDSVQVFDSLTPDGRMKVAGDRYHPRRDELHGLDYLLPIARGAAPRDLWLRLTSTSTRQIHVQALNIDDLNRVTHEQALIFAGYLGLVFVFAIWGGMSCPLFFVFQGSMINIET